MVSLAKGRLMFKKKLNIYDGLKLNKITKSVRVKYMKTVNLKIWEPVTRRDQIKENSVLKIIGFAEKDSYKRITVKKLLYMENSKGKKWIEVLINKKKNYYFNLDAYLGKESCWGSWVSELYVRKVNPHHGAGEQDKDEA